MLYIVDQESYQYQHNKQLPVTSYHWRWIKNSTNINKTNNYLSYHITEDESRILPISTKQTTTCHIISLNMNQEFYQYQQNKQLPVTSYQQNKQLPLISYHWRWIKNSNNINKTNNYLSYHITEQESRILPISTKQTSTCHIISTKQTTTSHIISLNMNQELYQYQQNKKLPLIPYHWTWIKNSTNINKTNNYLSHHITEHESRILPMSTKQTTTSHIISLNMNQEFYKYQQNKQLPLISYQQSKQLPVTSYH